MCKGRKGTKVLQVGLLVLGMACAVGDPGFVMSCCVLHWEGGSLIFPSSAFQAECIFAHHLIYRYCVSLNFESCVYLSRRFQILNSCNGDNRVDYIFIT